MNNNKQVNMKSDAVAQIFDRVKSVALWSAKKKRTIKGYGSAASITPDLHNVNVCNVCPDN
jgi:hypothetical protein